ncbi:hypothetical protein LCGC14_0669430 [marine sediment metagenome]|uniref:ABC transporter domain-containing protein n=1 Tax=marine sediment metagenome TaxID=412755 RepID=A0A0F9QWM4_9ZZZZ
MPGPHNILHIQDLYKEYGDNLVLDNVDLSVQEGEFCTVVGPSGCGKSTLLRLILGQEMPTKGSLQIDGKPVGFANAERGIVYQKYSLFPQLSVIDNVLLGKKLGANKAQWRAHKEELKDEAMHFLSSVKLAAHAGKYPHELSGGMQQRVAVMQALIMKPRILLMDEPFGALDPGTREDIQLFLLEQQQKHNMTLFFVTHDLEEAVFLGSRLLVLSQYYTDNRGPNVRRGAKVVADHCIKHLDDIQASVSEKTTADFGKLIEWIRHEGFDPKNLQHVDDFSLLHDHSFSTLTKEESLQGE